MPVTRLAKQSLVTVLNRFRHAATVRPMPLFDGHDCCQSTLIYWITPPERQEPSFAEEGPAQQEERGSPPAEGGRQLSDTPPYGRRPRSSARRILDIVAGPAHKRQGRPSTEGGRSTLPPAEGGRKTSDTPRVGERLRSRPRELVDVLELALLPKKMLGNHSISVACTSIEIQ